MRQHADKLPNLCRRKREVARQAKESLSSTVHGIALIADDCLREARFRDGIQARPGRMIVMTMNTGHPAKVRGAFPALCVSEPPCPSHYLALASATCWALPLPWQRVPQTTAMRAIVGFELRICGHTRTRHSDPPSTGPLAVMFVGLAKVALRAQCLKILQHCFSPICP